MEKYNFKGIILSPVTIGSGEEVEPFEYLIQQGLFYRISLENLISDFNEKDRDTFYEIVDSGHINNLRKFIVNRIDVEKHSLYCCQVSGSVEETYKQKFNEIENQLLITSFIRNKISFLPYIPGSSIKGAVRTAVISETGKELDSRTMNKINNLKKWEIQKKIEGFILESQDKKEFLNAKKDPFRAVKIRDVNLPDNATIITQVRNMSKNRRGHLMSKSMQLLYEVTKSRLYGGDVDFSGEIIIDNDLQGKRGVSKNISIEMIKECCNSFYRDKLEMEHEKFYQQSELGSNSESLLNEEIDNNSFLLRLGRFSGVESVTLDNFRDPQPPGRSRSWGKSRNVCEEKYPMGWVKITIQ